MTPAPRRRHNRSDAHPHQPHARSPPTDTDQRARAAGSLPLAFAAETPALAALSPHDPSQLGQPISQYYQGSLTAPDFRSDFYWNLACHRPVGVWRLP